jgi:hypothetical protein
MKAFFWVGLAVVILGIISLVVPIPDTDRNSVAVGGVSVGVETRHDEKVSPWVSAVMILGGAGIMIGAKFGG